MYSELALDLRQDRLVTFLQDRALQTLVAAGARHLQGLSGERYALRFARQTFWVVDRWNVDEGRSVRTLSGGETFLASLALALSEQVRALSITGAGAVGRPVPGRGFRNADADSLRVVQDAIEQLGGMGGRGRHHTRAGPGRGAAADRSREVDARQPLASAERISFAVAGVAGCDNRSVPSAADPRKSFDQAAEIYDEIRPSYPAAAFDDLFALLPPRPNIIEVGPGTGQATRDILRRGAVVHAIEIGPAWRPSSGPICLRTHSR